MAQEDPRICSILGTEEMQRVPPGRLLRTVPYRHETTEPYGIVGWNKDTKQALPQLPPAGIKFFMWSMSSQSGTPFGPEYSPH